MPEMSFRLNSTKAVKWASADLVFVQFGCFCISLQNRRLALSVPGLSYYEILRMLTIRKDGLPNYEQLQEQFQELNKRLEFINMSEINQ